MCVQAGGATEFWGRLAPRGGIHLLVHGEDFQKQRSLHRTFLIRALRGPAQCLGQRRFTGLGDVQLQGMDIVQGLTVAGLRVARADLAGTAGEQFARVLEADATVGTGDEDDCSVFNLHGDT
jgi:hypothetical protein